MFVDWALRTRSVDSLRGQAGRAGWELPPPWEGSRRRPDGQVLRWRTQDVDTGRRGSPSRLPSSGTSPRPSTWWRRLSTRAVRTPSPAWSSARSTRDMFASSSICCWATPIFTEVRTAGLDGIKELVLASPHGNLVVDATLGG